jgi:hypothetical protein
MSRWTVAPCLKGRERLTNGTLAQRRVAGLFEAEEGTELRIQILVRERVSRELVVEEVVDHPLREGNRIQCHVLSPALLTSVLVWSALRDQCSSMACTNSRRTSLARATRRSPSSRRM